MGGQTRQDVDDEDQRHAMGRNTAEWAEVMKERLDLDAMPLDEIMSEVMALVLERLEANLPVLPGALEAVQTAASRYRVGLASGSPIPVIKRVMRANRAGCGYSR